MFLSLQDIFLNLELMEHFLIFLFKSSFLSFMAFISLFSPAGTMLHHSYTKQSLIADRRIGWCHSKNSESTESFIADPALFWSQLANGRFLQRMEELSAEAASDLFLTFSGSLLNKAISFSVVYHCTQRREMKLVKDLEKKSGDGVTERAEEKRKNCSVQVLEMRLLSGG